MEDRIILVDKKDKQIGTEFKLKAHQEGKLHRAFSIFVFNDKGELMLQKRALTKYHSGGLWTNTCCSHPRAGEALEDSTHRRLKEEMGFDCDLKEVFSFVYKVKLNNELTEHEFLHVFVGRFNQNPIINKKEAEDFTWVTAEFLDSDVKQHPDRYTYWFKKCYKKVFNHILVKR